ncbi:hypothetical protein C4K68_03090 [Pokkaliibacter plantistimulans]|uniref:MOSC domain-containing protein n=1 Tax=Proteobacteria bacterium 228 TaxID=2083153 RepID=A0A2S5KVQ0_9PROT|nr:YcbX family protein [Pokkaliibacter plantistimulans]PPC78840.1 hypothetical protein C4K68_03090 [Pokkaliibacter plantistimulans]
MTVSLSDILVYPVKSCRGLSMSHAWVEPEGLAWDRRWVVVEPDGRFITARTHPKLALLRCHILQQGLLLRAPDMEDLHLHIPDFINEYQPISIWKSELQGQLTLNIADEWLSRWLGLPVALRYQGVDSFREIKQTGLPVSFADGYPLLLTSEASLAYLQERCPEAISMQRFRSNLVVEGSLPFIEDSWTEIRIGEVRFAVVKPCSRCVFTTLDVDSQQFSTAVEPLSTLQTFRQDDDGEVYFGMNLIPLNSGSVLKGDQVEVLSSTRVRAYPLRPRQTGVDVQPAASKQVKVRLHDHRLDSVREFEASSSRTLLEQAEDNGVSLPYSCRAGLCGSCRVRVRKGQVVSRSQAPLSAEEIAGGVVLACCSYALDDVELTLDN